MNYFLNFLFQWRMNGGIAGMKGGYCLLGGCQLNNITESRRQLDVYL